MTEGVLFQRPVWEYPQSGLSHFVGCEYVIDAVLLRTGETVYWELPSGAHLLPSYPVDGEEPLGTVGSVPEELRDALLGLLPEGEVVRVRIRAVFTGLGSRDEIEVHNAEALDDTDDTDDNGGNAAEAVAWLFANEIERYREEHEEELSRYLNYTGDW